MQLVKSIVRPQRVQAVRDALERVGVCGMTLMEARGHGRHLGPAIAYRGRSYHPALPPRMVVECVVPDHLTRIAVQAVIDAARTGEAGDGRIFVTPVSASYIIRTGELESSS